MKIVYLHQYFNTADVFGSVRSYEFARRLVRDGHEVHIITTNRSGKLATKSWNLVEIEGIAVHSVNQPYNNSMTPKDRIKAFLNFAWNASLRARSLKGDLVFATSTPLTIVLPALFATFARKTPFVMEVRDLWPAVPIAMGYLNNPLARFAARALERLAYHRAARIVALSPDMAEGVINVDRQKDKVSIIPNLSDTARFRQEGSEPEEFYDRYPQLERRPFVVYTGTFGKVNGVEYMAKLASFYASIDPNLAFVAMGDGAERPQVEKLAAELGVLNDNFFIFDPVPKKDLPSVLAAATACASWVVPIKELEANSANKLFDAFAAGRPVLINHGGWQKELLEVSGAGLALSASDLRDAARLLSLHLSDFQWLTNARKASAELGREKFEVEKLYQDFHRVLLEASKERPVGARGARS